MDRAQEEQRCPPCGAVLKALLLMGVKPDGSVCERCERWYSDELKPLARVI
jgi:hypothetical protein